MKRIGLIGGMSWESTAVYYRRLNEGVRAACGGLHSADIVLRSLNFHDVVALQQAGDWDEASRQLRTTARELEAAGAGMVLICTNTMHLLAGPVQAAIGVPLLHIADVTGQAVAATGARRPLLLATRYTMEQPFYRDRLTARFGLDPVIPEAADRAEMHRIIFDELCCGVISEPSRQSIRAIVGRGIAAGADAVILGCTEIGLSVGPQDFAIPCFDSTLLHADAAVTLSLAGSPALRQGASVLTESTA